MSASGWLSYSGVLVRVKGLFLLAVMALLFLFVGRAEPAVVSAEAPVTLAVAQTLETTY